MTGRLLPLRCAWAGIFLLIAGCGTTLIEQRQHDIVDNSQATRASCDAALAVQQDAIAAQQQALEAQTQQLQALQQAIEDIPQPQPVPPAPAVSCPAPPEAVQEPEPGKLMVGRRETVWLEEFGLALPARIDTGAETASLDARDIEMFERDGRNWVRFSIVHPDSGEPVEMERRLVRRARIIQANTDQAERRAVIRLGIVVGDVRQTAEFTLSNRSHLDYQVLVGRNVRSDMMIVEVSQVNLAPLSRPDDSSP